MAITHGETIHHMKLTASGQVSVPAEVRRRWTTTRVKITDLGDRLIVEPEPENRFSKYRGILARLPVTSDEMRALNRAEDRAAEDASDAG